MPLAGRRRWLGLEAPILLAPDARRMLGLWGRPGRWPGTVAGLVLLDYDNLPRVAAPLGYVGSVSTGVRTWHLPGDPPPRSSTPPAA